MVSKLKWQPTRFSWDVGASLNYKYLLSRFQYKLSYLYCIIIFRKIWKIATVGLFKSENWSIIMVSLNDDKLSSWITRIKLMIGPLCDNCIYYMNHDGRIHTFSLLFEHFPVFTCKVNLEFRLECFGLSVVNHDFPSI